MPVVVRASGMRRTETPNAVMTTVASPTQGPSSRLSMWRVEMRPGQRGPRHIFDSEQVWHVLDGQVEISAGGDLLTLGPGDAIVLAAGLERQISAVTAAHLIVSGHATATATASGEAMAGVVPAWIS
ncbi:cupin domain-containing protein [Frankia sp. R82]|uniref:cupin domain-containing protein n=1 Tax=Frankia sp. R82 TaxID=2950553 RepID=UPI002044C738|nr:cupin domain-containing protein [Frankia sp. R82]MCM3882545.1 cupin domain-containing protein [Frankia sp. R82]